MDGGRGGGSDLLANSRRMVSNKPDCWLISTVRSQDTGAPALGSHAFILCFCLLQPWGVDLGFHADRTSILPLS